MVLHYDIGGIHPMLPLFATGESIEPRINACSIYLSPFVFNLHKREYIYFLNKTHNFNYCMFRIFKVFYCVDNPLSWNGISLYVDENFYPPPPPAPCSESTIPSLGPLPNPHCHSVSLPANTCKYYSTDDINIPESSTVGPSSLAGNVPSSNISNTTHVLA